MTDIDYQLFLDCVHCGLCTSACPTYVELGDENDSPRGRIYLMRAVTDKRIELDDKVRGHLDLCLDCRACESACPSGVKYGQLIEPFRLNMAAAGQSQHIGWFKRLMLFGLTPYSKRMRWALKPAKLLQWSGVDWLLSQLGLFRILPRSLGDVHAMLPPLRKHYGKLPEVLPAEGPKRARVALFIGCAADAFFPQTTIATIKVLQKNGCEVWIPPGQVCCGALHYHAAQADAARGFAEQNCAVFDPDSVDAIITNAAGCGVMLKEYHHLLPGSSVEAAATTFARKSRDICEFLMELGPIKPEHPLQLRAVYHDACHLCHGQQIRKQPRQLLEMIPGLELLPLSESEICCGAAGSYNLTQPEMAERLGERKSNNLLEPQPDAVFAGNVGCLLQIGRYMRRRSRRVWIAHPVDALWASYSGRR